MGDGQTLGRAHRAQPAAELPSSGRKVPELDRDDLREIVKRGYRIVYRWLYALPSELDDQIRQLADLLRKLPAEAQVVAKAREIQALKRFHPLSQHVSCFRPPASRCNFGQRQELDGNDSPTLL